MFTQRVLTAFCKRSPAFFLMRGNLEKVILGQCAKVMMPEKSPMMFMPINFSNFSTAEKTSQISDAPKEKEEVTDKNATEANEKTETKKARKKRETKTGETPKTTKKGLAKTVSAKTATANFYKTILNRVADTCVIYMQASSEERSKIPADSRFYYVKEIIDPLDQDEHASFLEYLVNKDRFFQYETFNYQKQDVRKEGTMKKSQVKALNVEIHENSFGEKERIYTYKNMSKSKKVVRQFLQEPINDNGPRLHELILKFIDKENPDFKWYTSYNEDEKAIGKFVQKDPVRGQKQDTRNAIKTNVELAKKRFRTLDRLIKK